MSEQQRNRGNGAPSSKRVIPALLAAVLEHVPESPIRSQKEPMIGAVPKSLAEEGNCAQSFEDQFYPDDFANEARKAYCRGCPAQTDCMIWALRNEGFGIWGLTEGERAALGGVRHRYIRRRPGAATRAASRAIKGGIDPDNLAAALMEVHDIEVQPALVEHPVASATAQPAA